MDSSKPVTTIQVRMPDGRLQVKLNTTHNVGDIRSYIRYKIKLLLFFFWFRPSNSIPMSAMTGLPTSPLYHSSVEICVEH